MTLTRVEHTHVLSFNRPNSNCDAENEICQFDENMCANAQAQIRFRSAASPNVEDVENGERSFIFHRRTTPPVFVIDPRVMVNSGLLTYSLCSYFQK